MKNSLRNNIGVLLLVAFSLAGHVSFGQTDSLTLSSGSAASNGTVSLNLNLASPTGNEPVDVQWTLTYPQSSVNAISVTAGPAATAAGKALNCFAGSGTYTCLLSGLSTTIIANGTVAFVGLTMAGGTTATSIGLNNSEGSSASGNGIVVLPGGGVVTGGSGSASSALYRGLDTTTQGTWTGKYGNDGYLIANDGNKTPAYAAVGLAGDTPYTWCTSTSDPRALQVSSGSSSRIASTYYSSGFTINVNLTDGNTHRIALYLFDWDMDLRSETISIVDAASNTVLNTEKFSSFSNGQYAAWNVQGHVLIQVKLITGANAVVSGIFFDP